MPLSRLALHHSRMEGYQKTAWLPTLLNIPTSSAALAADSGGSEQTKKRRFLHAPSIFPRLLSRSSSINPCVRLPILSAITASLTEHGHSAPPRCTAFGWQTVLYTTKTLTLRAEGRPPRFERLKLPVRRAGTGDGGEHSRSETPPRPASRAE